MTAVELDNRTVPLFVIVSGNPFDGLEITGPFEDGNDANEYADRNHDDDTYWILTVAAPYERTGEDDA